MPHDQCTVAGNQGKPLRKCPEREQRAGLMCEGVSQAAPERWEYLGMVLSF